MQYLLIYTNSKKKWKLLSYIFKLWNCQRSFLVLEFFVKCFKHFQWTIFSNICRLSKTAFVMLWHAELTFKVCTSSHRTSFEMPVMPRSWVGFPWWTISSSHYKSLQIKESAECICVNVIYCKCQKHQGRFVCTRISFYTFSLLEISNHR